MIAALVLLALAAGVILLADPAIGAWLLAAMNLPPEPPWTDGWLAERTRLILAAWTPLGLAGLLLWLGAAGNAGDRDRTRRTLLRVAACLSAALAFYPLALAAPFLSQGLASILALLAIALSAVLVYRSGLPLFGEAPRVLEAWRWWREGVWLLAVLLATLGLRSFTFLEAFERDLMVYATVAQGWLEGAALYAEMWDHKPPATHGVYALAIWLFGATPAALYALGVAAFAASALGVLVAARRLGGVWAGPPALLLWFAFGNDPLLAANQPNVEVFIAPCLAWAFALLILPGEQGLGRRVWAIGLLFFLATAFKQVMVLVPLCVALALLALAYAQPLEQRRQALRKALGDIMGLLAVGLIGWAFLFALFAIQGSLAAFYQAAFVFNQDYAGNVFSNMARGFAIAVRNPAGYPFVVAACFFGMVGLLRWRSRAHLLTAAFLLGAGLAAFAPGRFFAHYYQLLTPLLALAGGALIAQALVGWRAIPVALAAGLFALTAFVYYDPGRLPLIKHAGHGLESLESKALGLRLARDLPPEAEIYHWGAEPGIYFWSGRLAPVGFVYSYPLLHDKRPADYDDRALAEFFALNPAVIVANRKTLAADHPLAEVIRETYRPDRHFGDYETFEVLVPKP
ncbi:MAG: hypothetical protein Kilf2KO_31380 [Rhodospirillales bacterium]